MSGNGLRASTIRRQEKSSACHSGHAMKEPFENNTTHSILAGPAWKVANHLLLGTWICSYTSKCLLAWVGCLRYDLPARKCMIRVANVTMAATLTTTCALGANTATFKGIFRDYCADLPQQCVACRTCRIYASQELKTNNCRPHLKVGAPGH